MQVHNKNEPAVTQNRRPVYFNFRNYTLSFFSMIFAVTK